MSNLKLSDFGNHRTDFDKSDLPAINTVMTLQRDIIFKQHGKTQKIARILVDGFEEYVLTSRLSEVKNYTLIDVKERFCIQSPEDKRLFISIDKIKDER